MANAEGVVLRIEDPRQGAFARVEDVFHTTNKSIGSGQDFWKTFPHPLSTATRLVRPMPESRLQNMNHNERPPTEHLFLFRNTDWDHGLSPEEMQRVLDSTMAWFARLHEQGRVKAAQPLFDEGKVVSGSGGKNMTDGPFAEAKESVGGYLVLSEGPFDEALAIARTWPMLDHGGKVEVRPVASECPSVQRLRKQAADALA